MNSRTINFNGLEYKTVLSPYTNRIWLDRNLGATRVALAAADNAAYGHYYQWGRGADGHELAGSPTTTVLASSITPATNKLIVGDSGWVAVGVDDTGSSRMAAWADGGTNDICPPGFGVPTKLELDYERLALNLPSTDSNYRSSIDLFLKIPNAGYRDTINTYTDKNIHVYLWVNEFNDVFFVFGVDVGRPYFLNGTFIANTSGINPKVAGMPVRCIKN